MNRIDLFDTPAEDSHEFGFDIVAFHEVAGVWAQSQEPFPVDFDVAWKWIGYSRKDVAKDVLLKEFTQGVDYHQERQMVEMAQGGFRKEFLITLSVDCFKHFCMMARTERGRAVRAAYIRLEQRQFAQAKCDALHAAFDLPKTYDDAILTLANFVATKKRLEVKVAEMQPKADFADQITASTDEFMVGVSAKMLNLTIGQNRFFARLRVDRILFYQPRENSSAKDNVPYQTYIDRGYFRVAVGTYTVEGKPHPYPKTLVTTKGLEWLAARYQDLRRVSEVRSGPND